MTCVSSKMSQKPLKLTHKLFLDCNPCKTAVSYCYPSFNAPQKQCSSTLKHQKTTRVPFSTPKLGFFGAFQVQLPKNMEMTRKNGQKLRKIVKLAARGVRSRSKKKSTTQFEYARQFSFTFQSMNVAF